MTDKSEWQGRVGQTWAAESRRTDRSFGLLTERLLSRVREYTARNLLDIGCGAGELSLAIARSRPEISVTGIDVSPDLLAVAMERGSGLGNVQFELADAAQWCPQPDAAPELLVSRHGVMFFDNPERAFANLADQAKGTAEMLFSCFRGLGDNPFATEVARLLPTPLPVAEPDAPGPFAFADRDRVVPILRTAGWEAIQFERFDFPMILGVGSDGVADAVSYLAAIGPAAAAARDLDLAARERFFDRVRTLAQNNCYEGVVSLPASAWIVSARRSR